MSSADHPDPDRQTERVNRVIEDLLRSYAVSKPRTWSSLFQQVEFAYNATVHASTGSSMRQLGNNIAHEQQQKARQANEKGRSNTTKFELGDLVYIHKSAVPPTVLGNPKLQASWIGPFPIKKIVRATSLRLELPDDWRIHPTF
ncbi:hypothetical protein H310_15005 [Aphanomyces invadans]|uniref:Tf2-1-like SH3-like domain-containing protein n=1 Tax=Aphanomyces invadans TaxID=157072 RepID=A0A024T957_9STRA|nr:hypothetical protein H310_15005 [Aphanomyces invadans]ETV90161.1 hypothetical protein H310_15005 [Aphanomyces invadans]|eukprot:XP_008881207.1 hypothetical protein H310_15005 [Aphanomyces invadans]